MSEVGAITAFNVFVGGMSKRVNLEAEDTLVKPRRELVDLFLVKNPEYRQYRKSLEPGDNIELSVEAFNKETAGG
jgi:hypothetical protein